MFSPISYLLAPAIVTGKLYNDKFKLHFILLLPTCVGVGAGLLLLEDDLVGVVAAGSESEVGLAGRGWGRREKVSPRQRTAGGVEM